MRQIILLSPLFFLLLIPVGKAGEIEQLDEIMKAKQAPIGVVFEIVGGDADSLQIAIKRVKSHIEKIKLQFPDTKFVVMSHGVEQFSLLKDRQTDHPELHNQVQRLVKDDNIPLQVCGSFAGMMEVDDNDFLSFIEVVDSAPAQIEFYKYKGYSIIEMDLEINN